MKIWQKTIAVVATFALLLNSISAPLVVLAQEETPSPTPEATAEATAEPTTSDTVIEETTTPEATPEVTPSEIATPTPEVTPVATDLETPAPTGQPVVTQTPESNPTTTSSPASTEPSSTPTATPVISTDIQTETGTLSATVLKDETLSTSALDQFDVTYQTDGSASISTDKLDYSPTDTAIISGVGFTPDKTYTIEVTSSDPPALDFSAPVTTNDKGEILYSYTLDGNYRSNYQVKVLDLERVVATTSFTDSFALMMLVTLNGISPFVATSGSSVTANVTMWLANNTNWKYTSYQIDSEGTQYVDTANHTGSGLLGTNYTETFSLTAPTTPGVYSIIFRTFSDDLHTSKIAESLPILLTVIDNTGPVITPTITGTLGDNGWYTSDVNVSWSVTDPESTIILTKTGCNPISINSDTPSKTITCSATSLGGSSSKSVTIKIDKTPPSIPVPTWPIDISINNNAPLMQWGVSTDSGSGMTGYNYQVYYNCSDTLNIPTSCSEHYVYPSLITNNQLQAGKTDDGTYYWQVRAKDNAGNYSGWSSFEKVTIDTTSPTVHFVFPTPGPSAISFQAVFSKDVNSIEASDPANYFLHNWPGYGDTDLVGHADDISYNSVSHTATITFTDPNWYISPEQNWGVENIHDLAGNLQSVNPYSEYSTPMVAPVTTDSGTDSSWHKSFTVTLSCTDTDGSGCKNTYYTTNGSDPTTSSLSGNSIVLNSDGIYTIKYFSTDNAGNTENIKNAANTVKIDTTSPAGDWVYPTNDSTVSGTVHLNFVSTDNVGPVTIAYQYKKDNGLDTSWHSIGNDWDTTGLDIESPYILEATATDEVGNSITSDIAVNVAAVIIGGPNSTTPDTNSAVITWTTDRPTKSRVVYDTTNHPDISGCSYPNYCYFYSTTEDTNYVTNHSVTITGLTPGQAYFYRVVSEGSPVSISGESGFQPLTEAGWNGSSSATGGYFNTGWPTGVVAGASTQNAIRTAIAYLPENTGENVLGAGTSSATPPPTPKVLGTETSQNGGIFNWILTHKKIDLGILLILLAISYGIYQIAKKKK